MLQGLKLKSESLRIGPGKTRKLLGGAALQADPGENLGKGRQLLGPLLFRTQDNTSGLQDKSQFLR